METEFVTNLEVDVIRLGLCVLQQNQEQCATFCGKLHRESLVPSVNTFIWAKLSKLSVARSNIVNLTLSHIASKNTGQRCWLSDLSRPFLLLNIKAGTVPPDTIYAFDRISDDDIRLKFPSRWPGKFTTKGHGYASTSVG